MKIFDKEFAFSSLNANDIDNAARTIAGTARSMGITTDEI